MLVTPTDDGWFRVQIGAAFTGGDHSFYLVLKQFAPYVGTGTGSVRVRRLYLREDRTTDGRWVRQPQSFIQNTALPATNPQNGGMLIANGGALIYIGSDGTITPLGDA